MCTASLVGAVLIKKSKAAVFWLRPIEDAMHATTRLKIRKLSITEGLGLNRNASTHKNRPVNGACFPLVDHRRCPVGLKLAVSKPLFDFFDLTGTEKQKFQRMQMRVSSGYRKGFKSYEIKAISK